MRPTAHGQLVGLDLLRIAAALLVLTHHLAFVTWAQHHTETTHRFLGPFAWFGWIGVEIFFVLSGFIIAYTAQRATPASFLKNRFIRLYPAAWLCSSVTVLFIFFSHREHPAFPLGEAWFASALLLPGGLYVDGAYWTLPVEMTFYAMVFALLLFRSLAHLGFVISVIGLISAGSWIFFVACTHAILHPSGLSLSYFHFLITNRLIRPLILEYGCFFAIGSLLWLCFRDRPSIGRFAVLAACIAGAIAEIDSHALAIQHLYFITPGPGYSVITPVGIWLAAVACIVLAIHRNAASANLLGQRGMVIARLFGLVTYPLYLVHQVVGYIAIGFFHGYLPDLLCLVLTILLLVAAALAIHLYGERPLQSLLRTSLFATQKLATAPTSTLT